MQQQKRQAIAPAFSKIEEKDFTWKENLFDGVLFEKPVESGR